MIRSRMLMGRKPRRLSQAFLRKERERLHRYRRDVREQQISGMVSKNSETKGLFNIPAALTVGQRVSALHAGKGNVLAVIDIDVIPKLVSTEFNSIYRSSVWRRSRCRYYVRSLSLSLSLSHTHTHNDRPHGMPRMLITRGDGTPNLITSPERGTSSYSTSIVMPEEEDAQKIFETIGTF